MMRFPRWVGVTSPDPTEPALDTLYLSVDPARWEEFGRALMDLGAWLRSLGLEQYEAVFAENAIELSVLPDLTDQDLEKLGVLLGHRRKLLRAIASLEAASRSAPGIAVGTLASDCAAGGGRAYS